MHVLLEEPIAVGIDGAQALGGRNGDVVEADTDNLAVLAVCPVNPGKLLALARTKSQPDVAELADKGAGDVLEVLVRRKVGHNPVGRAPGRNSQGGQDDIVCKLHGESDE